MVLVIRHFLEKLYLGDVGFDSGIVLGAVGVTAGSSGTFWGHLADRKVDRTNHSTKQRAEDAGGRRKWGLPAPRTNIVRARG